jgi:hypothetical protein
MMLLLSPALGQADDAKTVTTGRQGDRPLSFEGGLGTEYEGLVVAVLGSCSVDAEGTKDQWERALTADHLRVRFAKPRLFAVDVGRRHVEADEVVVTLSATALPDTVLVRSGKGYRSFGKYDPKIGFFIQDRLKSLPPGDLRQQPQGRAAADDEEAAGRLVAWGKATSGLQAGLALRPAEKRTFRVGDTARFVVRVRNGGDHPVEMRYLAVEAAARVGPSVLDAIGKRSPVSGPAFSSVGGRAVSKLALAPGEEVEFTSSDLTFGQVGESRVQEKATVQGGSGKYRVSYHVHCVKPDDTGNSFTTGEVEVEVTQPPERMP